MTKKPSQKVTIGRAELLHFVGFNIADIPAKVDTGAYRSSVHADNIRLIKDGKVLSFRLLDNHPLFGSLATDVKTKNFTKGWTTSSFGHRKKRYRVRLRVKLGPKTFLATFSLADRKAHVYPVLVGREILNRRFVVDTSKTSVSRRELMKQYGIALPIEDQEGEKLP